MAYTIKRNKKVFIVQESVPFEAEVATGADAVNVKYDSVQLDPTIEKLENMLISNGMHEGKQENGLKGVNGSLSTYCKANGVEGTLPEWYPLMEATLGANASISVTQNLDHTTQASTATRLEFDSAPNFKVGQHLLVKTVGAFECIPVKEVGADYVVLEYALQNAPADATAIAGVVTWDSKSKPTPVSIYVDVEKGGATESAHGVVVTGMTLSSASVGQQPQFDWALEGLKFDRSLNPLGLDPSYDTSKSPIVAGACLINSVTGEKYDFSEFSLSVENTWQIITNGCATDGKVAYEIISRAVTGTFNPNKTTDHQKHWDNFDQNISYGLSISFKVPSAVGEFKDVVGFYLPNVQTSNLTEAEDGVLKDSVEFRAFADGDKSTDKALIYISAI